MISLREILSGATYRAALASLFFTLVGAVAWWKIGWTDTSPPLFAYYAVLIINTFLSIRTFGALARGSIAQSVLDIVLIFMYVLLAFSIWSATLFAAVSAVLFFVSIIKYVHLQRHVSTALLLSRKIRLNTLAALLSCVAFGISLGFPQLAAWLLGAAFVLASIYLFLTDSMYRIGHEREAQETAP